MTIQALEAPQEIAPLASSGRIWSYRALFVLLMLTIWEMSSGRLLDPFWVSSPSAVFRTLMAWTLSGHLEYHLMITFKETIAGFLIGATTAVLCALVVGASDTIHRTVDPFVTAVYGVPKIALAPLFIMWFGIGLAPSSMGAARAE